eukprot:SAG22_NODE_129_length_18679_cov_40.656028_7_plen_71_part_00
MFGCLMRGDKLGFLRLVRFAVLASAAMSFLSENYLWVQREAVLNFSCKGGHFLDDFDAAFACQCHRLLRE